MENVSVSFNQQPILQEVNLKISDDDFLAIIGLTGGKSTLLKIILGL